MALPDELTRPARGSFPIADRWNSMDASARCAVGEIGLRKLADFWVEHPA